VPSCSHFKGRLGRESLFSLSFPLTHTHKHKHRHIKLSQPSSTPSSYKAVNNTQTKKHSNHGSHLHHVRPPLQAILRFVAADPSLRHSRCRSSASQPFALPFVVTRKALHGQRPQRCTHVAVIIVKATVRRPVMTETSSQTHARTRFSSCYNNSPISSARIPQGTSLDRSNQGTPQDDQGACNEKGNYSPPPFRYGHEKHPGHGSL
jgi:hypothetical protein